MSVVVYTTPTCGFCHQVKAYLNQRGVPFTEYDVSRDPQAAADMVRRSGQQGVPVILIDGQVVVGFRRPLIDQLLAQRATRPPRLGAVIADASRIAAKKGVQLPDGAYLGRVDPGSVAALAGLRPGDVIVQLAGQTVRTDQDVDRIMANVCPGQMVDLLVWRNGQTIRTTVRFQNTNGTNQRISESANSEIRSKVWANCKIYTHPSFGPRDTPAHCPQRDGRSDWADWSRSQSR